MRCNTCEYNWPDGLFSCPFCAGGLRLEPFDPDVEALAIDLARVDLASLYMYVKVADCLASRLKAWRRLAAIIARKLTHRPAWAPLYTSANVTFQLLGNDEIPPLARRIVGRYTKEFERLGFKHVGAWLLPQRINTPHFTIFMDSSGQYWGQLTIWKPGLAGSYVDCSIESHFSDGSVFLTCDQGYPSYTMAPWYDSNVLNGHSLSEIFQDQKERVDAASETKGASLMISTLDDFLKVSNMDVAKWIHWALETKTLSARKISECYTPMSRK